MVKLYEHPLSPYAQKVKIALAEKGVPFEAEIPPLAGGDLGQFRALNPRLEVPTLIDGDTAVFDSTVILEYIEDRWPTPPLLPKTPADGSRVAAWPDRVRTGPSVAAVVEAAAASMGGFEMLPQLIASGQFVREYRDHRLEWMMRSGGVEIVLDGMRKKNIRFTHQLA